MSFEKSTLIDLYGIELHESSCVPLGWAWVTYDDRHAFINPKDLKERTPDELGQLGVKRVPNLLRSGV